MPGAPRITIRCRGALARRVDGARARVAPELLSARAEALRRLAQPALEPAGGQWRRDVEALGRVAAAVGEQCPGVGPGHTLRHDVEAQPAAEVDRRAYDRRVPRVVGHAHDERAI